MTKIIKIDLLDIEAKVLNIKESVSIESLSQLINVLENLEKGNNIFDLISGITISDLNSIKSGNELLILRKTQTRFLEILFQVIIRLNIENSESIKLLNKLLLLKPTLSSLLSSSYHENSDYFLLALIKNNTEGNNVIVNNFQLLKIATLYCLNSTIPIQSILALFKDKLQLYIQFSFSLLSENPVISIYASNQRDWILNNLPKFIDCINSWDELKNYPIDFGRAYFLCSYSTDRNRHNIKESIHALFRRIKISNDLDAIHNKNSALGKNYLDKKERKNILVIHERFYSNHAVFRCLSNFFGILSEKHNVFGVCFQKEHIDDIAKSFFKSHYILDIEAMSDLFCNLSRIIKDNQIDIIYYPSIGMTMQTIICSSFKLAPKIVCTLAHPSPSLNKTTDCVISYTGLVESERDPYTKYKLLKTTHPMRLVFKDYKCPDNWQILEKKQHSYPLKIAITAAPQKITAQFIEIVRKISDIYTDSIEFIFHDASGNRATQSHLQIYLDQNLSSNVIVKSRLSYDKYLLSLKECILCLSPYPFGNHNGFLDCTLSGIIGPSLITGTIPQNTERLYYDLCGLQELITSTDEDYIKVISSLIDVGLGRKESSIYLNSKIKKPSEIIDVLVDCPQSYVEDVLSCF